MEKSPRVGVGAVILNEKQELLLVLRKRAPEADYWSLPGGKVDFMETIEEAVKREIAEELDVVIQLEKLLCVTNHLLPKEGIHYVAPTFYAIIKSGSVKNKEPEALADVQWFSLGNLPSKLTLTTTNALTYLPEYVVF